MVAVAKFSRHSFSLDEMTSVFLNSFFGFCCPSAPSFLRVYAKENAGVGGALDLEIDPSAFKRKIQTKKKFISRGVKTNKQTHRTHTTLCFGSGKKSWTGCNYCRALFFVAVRQQLYNAEKSSETGKKETDSRGNGRRWRASGGEFRLLFVERLSGSLLINVYQTW
jgi:hypothetical protein